MGVARKWFAEINGDAVGPLNNAALKQMASTGKLRPEDRVRQDGGDTWIAAASIRGLFNATPNGPQSKDVLPSGNPSEASGDVHPAVGVEDGVARVVANGERPPRMLFPTIRFYCRTLYVLGCVVSLGVFFAVLHFFSGAGIGLEGGLLVGLPAAFVAAIISGLPFFLADELLRMAVYAVGLLEDIRGR